MTLKAILWDMDGTLIDSEPAHQKAFLKALDSLGVSVGFGTQKEMLGLSSVEVHQRVVELTGLNITLAQWRAEKWRHYQYCSRNITPLKNSQAILDAFSAKAIPMALVSNSSRDELELNLEVTNLRNYFKVIISRDDVENGKPSPEGYLAAAKALSIKANECLVIEDSLTGVKAGLAAKMTTLFHPESDSLAPLCPEDAILLRPDKDLNAWLLKAFNYPDENRKR
jgi:HAD superfamily hydrolase (TIGR01509 family)